MLYPRIRLPLRCLTRPEPMPELKNKLSFLKSTGVLNDKEVRLIENGLINRENLEPKVGSAIRKLAETKKLNDFDKEIHSREADIRLNEISHVIFLRKKAATTHTVVVTKKRAA